MKLAEIIDSRDQLDLSMFIAVPKGTLWQKDIHNCWVFDTYAEAEKATQSSKARELLDKTSSSYLPVFKTGNGFGVVLLIPHDAFTALTSSRFEVLAVGPSEKSVRLAAAKVLDARGVHNYTLWCYKTYNSDPAFFKDDEE